MNVCRSSESIWYISHLLIIHVEWAKISWLSYRRVCPTLISPTFCKWGYYAKNKAEWTSAVWRASEKRGPHSYTCHLQTRLHYGFHTGNIVPSPLCLCLFSGNCGSLVIVRVRRLWYQNPDICFFCVGVGRRAHRFTSQVERSKWYTLVLRRLGTFFHWISWRSFRTLKLITLIEIRWRPPYWGNQGSEQVFL